jgi:competence protein ComEC
VSVRAVVRDDPNTRASQRTSLRLVPVGAGTWTTALLATFLPKTVPALALALWTGAMIVLTVVVVRAARRRHPARRPTAIVVLLALVCAAVVASHTAMAQPAREQVRDFALDGGRSLEIEALVIGKVQQRAGGHRSFDARAIAVTVGSRTERVAFDVTVRVDPADVDDPPSLDVGAIVSLDGTARATSPGDRAVLAVSARTVHVQKPPEGLAAVASDLRRGLIEATTDLPGPGAGLIPGLAVGDTSAVSADLDTAMKESSLSHLTAVSGANCAIVVGLAFGAVALGGGSRRARVIGGLVALGGFVVLVTPEPSVVRAGTMAAIAMGALLLGRAGAGLSLLSLAVTVLLIVDPWLAGSLGFALSAVATASLLVWARPLAHGLGRWMPRPLALALSVPLAAQLCCGPLLVLITPTVPLYGVAANLLAAPAAPIATVVGLAACLSASLPWVQSGLAAVAWVPASWIAGTAHVVSTLPADQMPWFEAWPGAVTLALVGGAVGVLIVVPSSTGRRRRATRAAALVLIAVVVGGQAGGAALGSVAGRWTIPAEWSVLACDIGQGDAVLLRSAETVALIDTGPEPEALDRCLARAGVHHIDLLVLTHFDLDHAGGAPTLVHSVGTVVHGPPASAADESLLAALRDGGARVLPAHAGQRGTLGTASWRVLWPPSESRAFPSGNDASVVIEVTDVSGGGVPRSVFLGDLSATPQAALAASGALRPPYDLVKVAHHGSADQDVGLYESIGPAVGLITVGTDNTFGHPRAEILDALTSRGVTIARTDRDGLVALWRDGGAIRLWRERGGEVGAAG